MTTAAAEARRAARDDIRHEHDALYVAKYATKAKPADHTTGCAPPAADAAAEAAAASGGGRWRCFTMDKESPFAAHAAAAGAVAAPLGVPGNKRVRVRRRLVRAVGPHGQVRDQAGGTCGTV